LFAVVIAVLLTPDVVGIHRRRCRLMAAIAAAVPAPPLRATGHALGKLHGAV
jgi:hypothetical protein